MYGKSKNDKQFELSSSHGLVLKVVAPRERKSIEVLGGGYLRCEELHL